MTMCSFIKTAQMLLVLLFCATSAVAQNPIRCREMSMDCLANCAQNCDGNAAVCIRGCKTTCFTPYECGNSRDVWSSERTAWCCACHGDRC